jgi:UPF0755 protein
MIAIMGIIAAAWFIPKLAWQTFGAPVDSLGPWQRFSYGMTLALHSGEMTQPVDIAGAEQTFIIQPDESVTSITSRLEQTGLIRSADTFRTYLLWTGLDTIIRSGTYKLSPARSGHDIAEALKSTTLTEVPFTVFPGWRMEEIAASIPTSGLDFTSEEFIEAASAPLVLPQGAPSGATAEGYLSPGVYTLPRTTTAEQLVYLLLQNFSMRLTPELQSGFQDHQLEPYQAVTLASIVQREAMVETEMPLIASVLYNRLAQGMPLQTDPTVQYALGFNSAQVTWWTSPLTAEDLQYDSPYNTYLHKGLPPGPIASPGQAALEAVANPAESSYLYCQARCDGSGLHNFSETLEQHQQNNCP